MLPGSRAGPRMLLSRTVAVLYQKDIPLSLPHSKKYHKKNKPNQQQQLLGEGSCKCVEQAGR